MKELLVAAIAAFGGALFLFLFTGRAEKRKFRIEHWERQIKELYGPLNSLITRTFILHEVFVKMVTTDPDGTEHRERLFEDGQPHPEKLEGKNKEIWDFFADEYFLPINAQMRDVIHSNYDLLDSALLPKSFQDFLRHEAQFKARREMERRDLGISNRQVEDNPWKEKFNADVENTLKEFNKKIEKAKGIQS